MSSVYDEISRLKTAKEDIETAIEICGVNVPDTSLISTYASYIRQIPSTIFSTLNVDISGGDDRYIKTIKQENGLIVATTGGEVSNLSSGLTPKIGTSAAATIGTQADEWVLASTKGEAPTWRKLPVGAFKTNKTLKFKNTSNTEVSYDGSTAIDLTGGIHYANTAANISGGAAGSIPYQTAAGTTAFLAKGTSGQVLKMNSSGLPYWTTDNNSNTWRAIQVNGTQIAGTETETYAANFISGTGITVAGTAGTSSAANKIIITNAGVRSIAISGNYLQVNTNGNTANLTIPYATKATCLTTTLNTITAPTDDTADTWMTKGNSVHMYSGLGQLNNQPSQFGLLLNLAYGSSDVHQIWATQSSGNLYHRGGNSGGWADNNAWRTILDSVNSSISGDGGDTWGSSITIKINNVSKTLTIPSNPNTDEKVAYTATTSNVAHPILFANNSTNTGTPTTGEVYYESNATSGAGLTYNPYSNLLNIPNGKLQINTTIRDHGATSDQCLYIYAPTPSSGTTITTKNSPGIGFKVEGNNWGSIVFNQGTFEFVKNDFVNYHNIRANILTSTAATGTAPLTIASTTLVENLNADMLDGFHASDFAVVGEVIISRVYKYNPDNSVELVYSISGNAVTNPQDNVLITMGAFLKAPIIEVISVTKTGNASSYIATKGSKQITVTFSGNTVATSGDSFKFKVLMGGGS